MTQTNEQNIGGTAVQDIKVWAHRGASHACPENTMAAFREAVAIGADGIETDVQRTKDGVIVVMHDENLQRLCGVNRYVKDMTMQEIAELSVKTSYGPDGHYPIPNLAELLDLVRTTDLTLNIELKDSIFLYEGMADQVREMVAERNMQHQVLYSSFNHVTMHNMAEKGFGEVCGLLYSDYLWDDAAYAQACGVRFLHPLFTNLQKQNYMQNMHAAGLGIHVWTPDKPEHIGMCLQLGVDAVITNEPALAMDLRKQFMARRTEVE